MTQVTGAAGMPIILEDSQGTRTTKSPGRGGGIATKEKGIQKTPRKRRGGSEGLSVGDVVRHRQNWELLGRIVEIDTTSARIELLTWPTDWWRQQWGKRPVPVLTENLELVE